MMKHPLTRQMPATARAIMCGVVAMAGIAGCGETAAEKSSGTGTGETGPAGGRTGSGSGGSGGGASRVGEAAVPTSGDSTGGTPRPGSGSVQAGTLTAGVWDDNGNFDRFLAYRAGLDSKQLSGLPPFSLAEHQDANAQQPAPRPHAKLDISLVIDTTGSMGDEIRYLQAEFTAISKAIEERFPMSSQRWSLVVYRDEGDDYVTRSFDFRDDPRDFRAHLVDQAAGGGGDFPEAPDQALAAMNQLAWRSGDDTARMAFWVADAPHHDDKAQAMAQAIRAARKAGIHVYPVASSGINELTEFTMRASAQLTNGRYLFLTDDSGVGGAHKEPSIPCYFVTKLDRAILRMVDIELGGSYRQPEVAEIIRTGGDPHDGACTLGSGEIVNLY